MGNTTNQCVVHLLYHKHVARYSVYDTINLPVSMYKLVGPVSRNAFLSASIYYAAIVSQFTKFCVTTTVEWRILKDLKGIFRDVIEILLSYLPAETK